MEGEVLVFVFSERNWQAGVLGRLPQPQCQFGIIFEKAKVTDAMVKDFTGLKSLQTLSLVNTEVTDVGVKELAGLKSLQTVFLGGTKVTEAGIAELRKALPGCRILR